MLNMNSNLNIVCRMINVKLVKELKAAAAKSKEIYLATDSDREGEAIAWHVQEAAEMDPEANETGGL